MVDRDRRDQVVRGREVAAFEVIQAFDWRFGLGADASDTAVATLQVIVAGPASAECIARLREDMSDTVKMR